METRGVAQQVEARKIAKFYFLQRVGQEVDDSDNQEDCQQVEVRRIAFNFLQRVATSWSGGEWLRQPGGLPASGGENHQLLHLFQAS